MQTEVTVSQDLIPVEKINVPELFTDRNKIITLIGLIRESANQHEPDLSTATTRKEIASNAYKVSQSKTWLVGVCKDFITSEKDAMAERLAKIESARLNSKFLSEELDKLRDEQRKPLTDWEEAEKAREAAEAAERQYLSDWDDAIHENDLFDRQREIERKEAEIAQAEAERKAKAESERLERERKEREERIANEAAKRALHKAEEMARLKHERIENEKREAEERAKEAERNRIMAEERAKEEARLAEERRIAAEKKAEQDRIQAIRDAEAKAKREADELERKRLAEEATKKAEAERIARNKNHQAKINREALEDLEANGVETDKAKEFIILVAQNKVRHITVNY